MGRLARSGYRYHWRHDIFYNTGAGAIGTAELIAKTYFNIL